MEKKKFEEKFASEVQVHSKVILIMLNIPRKLLMKKAGFIQETLDKL